MYLNIINLARVKQIDPLEQFDKNEHLTRIERNKLDGINREINNYKDLYELIDFTDMLDRFLVKGNTKNNKIKGGNANKMT